MSEEQEPKPTAVAIGGGHGLAATLRALRGRCERLTAVVAVTDDGTSSGRLRRAQRMPAPGDVRRCLVALAEEDSVWAPAMAHRFPDGDLAGHAVGNIVLAGLLADGALTFGDAVHRLSALLGVKEAVLPATEDVVDLAATTAGGDRVVGQVAVSDQADIDIVGFEPADPEAFPASVKAIDHADLVVLGPGSLFSSVLSAAVVPGIREAIDRTDALVVRIANLADEETETRGFTTDDFGAAFERHGVRVDRVLDDPAVADGSGRRHDPDRLGPALVDLWQSERS